MEIKAKWGVVFSQYRKGQEALLHLKENYIDNITPSQDYHRPPL
jgi:hypothetical protein